VDKKAYLSAMMRSVAKDIEIKHLLREALSDKIADRVMFMQGIDVSYFTRGIASLGQRICEVCGCGVGFLSRHHHPRENQGEGLR
jgi:hypothetical protein